MKYFVLIDYSDGEVYKKIFTSREQAINKVPVLNMSKTDVGENEPGWGIVTVDAQEGASPEQIFAMAKKIKEKEMAEQKKMIKKTIESVLGGDEVTEYLKKKIQIKESLDVDSALDNYINGNLEDFKQQIRSAKDLAELLIHINDQGVSIEIPRMLKLLTR